MVIIPEIVDMRIPPESNWIKDVPIWKRNEFTAQTPTNTTGIPEQIGTRYRAGHLPHKPGQCSPE